jgi:hypothetical protein
MWMAGYGGRSKPAEGKLTDLFVKVIVLEDAFGRVAVVVTSDLLGFPKSMYENTSRALHERFHIPPERVMLTSSHTHCGPVLRDALYDIYPLDQRQRDEIESYSAWLEAKLVELVGSALANRRPATLRAGRGIARFAVNRRNNPEKSVEILREQGALNGPVDHSVPVLAVHSFDGELLAVLFGYACHNTTLDFYRWCGDYAGFAQEVLEQRHRGTMAMFYMGCGADQNPLPRRSVELCQSYGRQLADAVDDVLRSDMELLAPTLETRRELIALEFGPAPTLQELQVLAATGTGHTQRWARRLLAQLDRGDEFPRTYPYPVAVWRLGGKQWLIGLGGEVVVDYSLRLKAEIGASTWIAGYANDVMAYIPSLRVLREGGYEGASSMVVYGLPAHRWAQNVEEHIVATVKRLVDSFETARSETSPRELGIGELKIRSGRKFRCARLSGRCRERCSAWPH